MLVSKYKYKDIFYKKDILFKEVSLKKLVNKILSEVNLAKGVEKYYDKKNNIRRIEKLYNKGTCLKNLNNKIEGYLKRYF